jgi:hypothetical protein
MDRSAISSFILGFGASGADVGADIGATVPGTVDGACGDFDGFTSQALSSKPLAVDALVADVADVALAPVEAAGLVDACLKAFSSTTSLV